MRMNKKTFTLAVLFLCVAVGLLVVNLIWFSKSCTKWDWTISVFLVIAGVLMVWNELHKKKRLHRSDVNHNEIP